MRRNHAKSWARSQASSTAQGINRTQPKSLWNSVAYIDATSDATLRHRNWMTLAKKRHTRQHLAAVDETKRLLIWTRARLGKRHERRSHDEDDMAAIVPDAISIQVDLGFQGWQKEYDNI